MGEEGPVVLAKQIYGHPGYLGRLGGALEKKKEELRKARTISEHYESLLLKYPPKEDKEKIKKIETVFPYKLWEKGLTGYGAEEKETVISIPITGVGRDVFAILDELAQQPLLKSETKIQQTSQFLRSNLDHIVGLAACSIITTIAVALLPFPANIVLLISGLLVIASGIISISR